MLKLLIVVLYVSFIFNISFCLLQIKADEDAPEIQVTPYTDEQLARIADDVLKLMDTNFDGFIEYAEYKTGNL